MLDRSCEAAAADYGHAPRQVRVHTAALKRKAARRIALPAIIGVLTLAFVLHSSSRASAIGVPTVSVTVPTVPTVPVAVPTVHAAVPTVTVAVTASGSGAGVGVSAGTSVTVGTHGASAGATVSVGTGGTGASAGPSAGTHGSGPTASGSGSVGTGASSAASASTGSGGPGSSAQASGSASGGRSGTATGSRGAGSRGAPAPVASGRLPIGAAAGLGDATTVFASDTTPPSTLARRVTRTTRRRGSAILRTRQADRSAADPRARNRTRLHRHAKARPAAGRPEPTRIYRKGNTYYYVRRLPNGQDATVVVQVPLSRSATVPGSPSSPSVSSSNQSSQSLPSDIPAVVSGVARGILNAVVAGGGGMGKLIGADFPLVPALLGVILLGVGALLRIRRFRFAD